MTEEKTELPEIVSNESGTSHGYTAQVRCMLEDPVIIDGKQYGSRWRTIDCTDCPPEFYIMSPGDGCILTYQGAQVVRWMFIVKSGYNSLAIETRLVKHKVTYQWENMAIEVKDLVEGKL